MVNSENGDVVLVSIKPQYARAILNGEKLVEYRRKKFGRKVIKVVVYSTTPVKKIVGCFEVEDIVEAKPSVLWGEFGKVGFIDRHIFERYYHGCSIGYGILVKKVRLYSCQIGLKVLNLKPPQSYQYLNMRQVALLDKLAV